MGLDRLEQYRQALNRHMDRIEHFMTQYTQNEFIHWKPSPEEWSVMETLCHVEEALNYWSNELKRVIEAGGTEWGRGLQDPIRLKAVEEASQRELPNVRECIHKAQQAALGVLSGLKDEDVDLQAPHRNPKFGVKPMSFLIEHFITEHMEIHAKQLERILEQYRQKMES